MSRTSLLFFLSLLQALVLVKCENTDCNGISFEEHPEDVVVDVGQDNVEFHCTPPTNYTPEQGYFFGWTFYSATGGQENFLRSMPDRNYEILTTSDLRITEVQSEHAGMYACRLNLEGECSTPLFSYNATLTVRGPPIVKIPQEDIPNRVETQSNLTIMGSVMGYPPPTITLVKVLDNEERVITSITDPRIVTTLIDASLEISIYAVRVEDEGIYKLKAENTRGRNESTFIITTIGPNPPVITVNENKEVNEVIVSKYGTMVTLTCSIQQTAIHNSLVITWLDPSQEAVPTVTDPQVSVYVSRSTDTQSATLTIRSLMMSQTGQYTCTATNSKGNARSYTTIFGPPRPPTKPTILVNGNRYTITWSRPAPSNPITAYMLYIFEAGLDVRSLSVRINVNESHSEASYTITDLASGEYDVRISAISGGVEGELGEPATFSVEIESSSSSSNFTLIGAVVGAVGVVVLLLIIGIAIGVFCLCFYYPHKQKKYSQQQRWGSEEDKPDSANAVPNTYTALTLHPSSELPPSPTSPTISSAFSTEIDPKWEFPKDNIQLSEVLFEGQFSVLYKGTAKGIMEKSIDVAVKTVKDDATEDDLKTLVYEMEMLASIGSHPNIVSLVRVCTVGKPIYMVMEYMCHGDLLGFLRASRGIPNMFSISPGARYQPPPLGLCSRDIINFAIKIANGMRYLADRKIVHRALCAKNILVGTSMEVKIYNIGSFDNPFDNRESLMKWMAPETLFDGTTTTYSDVWSFGVTLWELVTVGGAPYAEILPEDLYTQLHSGMRMPRPQHCAQEVYDIMRDCWQSNPTDRPHFSIVHDRLEELYISKLSYLDLRNYNGYAYSQFDEPPQLSTVL